MSKEKLPNSSEPSPESAEIELKNLLTYDNPNRKHYEEIIKTVETAVAQSGVLESPSYLDDLPAFKTQYVDKTMGVMLRPNPDYKAMQDLFRSELAGEIMVELGSSGDMGLAAERFKAGAYISVDRYLSDKYPVDPFIDLDRNLDKDEGEMQSMAVQDDMLDFVSRLPDNSVIIAINGIDLSIIPSKEYFECLAKEILRVTKSGKIMFGYHAEPLDILSERARRKVEQIPCPPWSPLTILRKKAEVK